MSDTSNKSSRNNTTHGQSGKAAPMTALQKLREVAKKRAFLKRVLENSKQPLSNAQEEKDNAGVPPNDGCPRAG